MEPLQPSRIELPGSIVAKWQEIVDIVAGLIGVPAALIMRVVASDIEVFVSSHGDANPYHPGDHEPLAGSGLYCETVINSNARLLVPDALADDKWKNNPDVKLDMISYLGFPIRLPGGELFGTICVLDNKVNAYSGRYEDLIDKFRDIIQSHLELIYMNTLLGDRNKSLTDYLEEIRMLRGIVPICSFCKRIRDAEGKWWNLETYLAKRGEAQFSHGICSECRKIQYGDFLPDP